MVLKCKYFKNSSFLEAKCPRTASFTWKSIMWGRELLNEGLRGRIGTCERVKIYRDRWIPIETRTRQVDTQRWHYGAKGSYIVRSCYHLAMNLRYEASGSDSSNCMRWWNSSRRFIYPLRLNLQNRGMCVDVSCPSCGFNVDSAIHVLWFCKEAKVVWKSWNGARMLKPEVNRKLQDLLIHAFKELNREDFAVFFILIWLIWHIRTVRLFGGDEKPKDQLVQWAQSYFEEYKEADKRWVPPKQWVFSVNVDADFTENGFRTGVVIRDWRVVVLASECRKYAGQIQVCIGEAFAVRDGVTLAIETNLTPFVINYDPKFVEDSFNNNKLLSNDVGLIAQDCFEILRSSICMGFVYVSRQTNNSSYVSKGSSF
ncbi:uncharacterized protein LOC126668244 [Mercurialis annua]|uniref:uncharacterized protein LOC126668244 n=1 Tax=Mercurialis annua TaxID=3986 RepID=UPI00215E62C9|nr:uncharacterized protein LOC126668244 [Mercurialis annua]